MRLILIACIVMIGASAYAADDELVTGIDLDCCVVDEDDDIETSPHGAIGFRYFGHILQPKDPYRNLPCGEGPHTVYNLFLVECDADPWFDENMRIDAKQMCRAYHAEEWTDWPRCEGVPVATVALTVDE